MNMNKSLLLLFSLMLGSLTAQTVYLYTDDYDTNIGDQLCIPIRTDNFENMAGFQFGLSWNHEVLEYAGYNHTEPLTDISLSDALVGEGQLRLLWLDSQNSPATLAAGDTIIEICFTVVSDWENPTELNITGFDGFHIEFTRNDLVIPAVEVSNGQIDITNLLDCFLVPICEDFQWQFEPGKTISLNDLIPDIDYFLDCHGYDIRDIYLLHLSQPDAQLNKEITFNCDNIYGPTNIGIVYKETRSAAPIDVYQLLCHSSITWDIPDIYEDCIQTDRSCLDPERCQHIELIIDSTVTEVKYSDIINIDQDCVVEYGTQYTSIDHDGDNLYDRFQLYCADYQQHLDINVHISHYFEDGAQLIGFDWCRASIDMSDYETICEDGNYKPDEMPIRIINEQQVSLELNDEPLSNRGAYLHIATREEVLDIFNTLTIGDNHGTLQNITTLDLVYLFRSLTGDDMSPPAAIAADIDLSGSVSTRDLINLRRHILGVVPHDTYGQLFMIETSTDFSGFDQYEFTNDYVNYRFDGPTVDFSEGLNFEIFRYGDITGSASSFHKTDPPLYLSDAHIDVVDRIVSAGEEAMISLSYPDALLGLTAYLKLSDVEIIDIVHSYTGDILQYHETEERLNLSFLSPKKAQKFKLTIKVKAIKAGRLSEMLQIDQSLYSEVVHYQDAHGPLSLSWSESHIDDPQVCIYPNPANHMIHIDIPSELVSGQLRISNVVGQVMYQQTISEQYMQIPVSDIAAKGIMIIQLKNGNTKHISRIHIE